MPLQVYQQIVSRSELTSGTASTEKRELPAEEAEHDPRVIREMAVRAEELQRCSEMCLTSVMNSISVIPVSSTPKNLLEHDITDAEPSSHFYPPKNFLSPVSHF